MLIAATSEPQRGWGGPFALLAALALFWVFRAVHQKITNHSPTPPERGGVKAIGAGRTRFTPVRRPGEPGPDPTARPADSGVDPGPPHRDPTSPGAEPGAEPWWGPIVERGGRRFRAAAHIARTGDSPPAEPVRDDFDDALDLVEPGDLDEWLGWAAAVPYNERVRRGAARFGISESSVKRRIRELKNEEGTQ